MELVIIPIIIFIIIAIIVTAVAIIVKTAEITATESGKRRAGRQGEIAATNAIRSVLRDGDLLFTNVEISYDGKPAELDNVIVNSFGVFIIEVKNYKGRLYGNEDDYEWTKYKEDGYGNTFEKKVKNPIKQVKRQVYVLAKYLNYHGIRVWVEGYALLLYGNSPINSTEILSNTDDIDRAIHTPGSNKLSGEQINFIANFIR